MGEGRRGRGGGGGWGGRGRGGGGGEEGEVGEGGGGEEGEEGCLGNFLEFVPIVHELFDFGSQPWRKGTANAFYFSGCVEIGYF